MAAALAVAIVCLPAWGAPPGGNDGKSARELAAEAAKIEFKAKQLMDRGIEFIELGQVEQGVKRLTSIPRLYPKAEMRFKVWLYLGKFHLKRSEFGQALKAFRNVAKATKDREQQAEATYQVGVCHFMIEQYDKAFMAFRKVTYEHPWSVYANQSYYYIGQCHFKLGRWSKAIEALELVGTSVPPNLPTITLAEAGQRIFAKIYDKDFVILVSKGHKITVKVSSKTGDEETIPAARLGRSGEYYIASIRSEPGRPVKGDDKIQFLGDDTITVTYVDRNTKSGEMDEKILASVKLVSTANAGFTDGAYREYTKGVYANDDCFLMVKDLDHDMTDAKDKIRVKLHTEWTEKVHRRAEEEDTDLEAPKEVTRIRDELEVELVETAEHSGIFVGTIVPRLVAAAEDARKGDKELSALQGDDIVLTYVDEKYLTGDELQTGKFDVSELEPRTVRAKAKILIGKLGNVRIDHRVVTAAKDRARKNLIEGRIYLKLGEIFKDVGLNEKAYDKAREGLTRVEDVVSSHLQVSLDRDVVERAFSVKWDLLLVQDRLPEAVGVCRTLMNLFPDSTLVDAALFKIAVAKRKAGDTSGAVQIFSEITRLKSSDMAAEAQFNIAEILEKGGEESAGEEPAKAFARALSAYQKCAELWPDSAYAGKSLGKIADYYIVTKDYVRAIELIERVFDEYEDQEFLPVLMSKWVVAAYRKKDFTLARAKANQLMETYPNSKEARKAKNYLKIIDKKLGQGGGPTKEEARAGTGQEEDAGISD